MVHVVYMLESSEMGDCLLNIPQPGRFSQISYQKSNYLNEYMEDLDKSFRFVLPGERYSATEQCQQIFGNKSYLCSFTVSLKRQTDKFFKNYHFEKQIIFLDAVSGLMVQSAHKSRRKLSNCKYQMGRRNIL
jgi:hypothetical protein